VKKATNGNVLNSFFAASTPGYYDGLTFGYNNADTLALNLANSAGNGNDYGPAFETTQVFRDPSAWYHIVLAIDTTQSTASNRVRVYVNGTQVTTFATTNYPAQNYETNDFNTAQIHYLGAAGGLFGGRFFSGYLADVFFIDSQALDPSAFGEFSATTGVWVPKAYTGGYGIGTAGATGALPIYNTTDANGAVKGTGTRADTSASSLVLAVPMDGANNGTTFTDESAAIRGSGSAKAFTRNGDSKTSTDQSKFYGSSGYFDGAGDYLTTPYTSDFNFPGDFTVETWVRPVSRANYSPCIIGNYSSFTTNGSLGIFAGHGSANNTKFQVAFNGTFPAIESSVPVSYNTWQHIAVVRSGSTITLYIDGVNNGSFSSSAAVVGTASNIWVGTAGDNLPTGYFNGYIQDLRVYKGAAKYTSNFVPVVSSNNSFHLDFADNSAATAAALGKDTSGNGNNFTPNNLSVTGQSAVGYPQGLTAGSGSVTDPFLAFDNSTTTFAIAGSSSTITFTPPQALSFSSKLEFYTSNGGGPGSGDQRYSCNGGSEVAGSGGEWTTVVTGAGTLTSLSIRNLAGGVSRLNAIRVDNNIVVYDSGAGNDSLIDVPVNGNEVDTGLGNRVRGNYAVLNPLRAASTITLSNGNLQYAINTSMPAFGRVESSIAQRSGKWYVEFLPVGTDRTKGFGVMQLNESNPTSLTQDLGNPANTPANAAYALGINGGSLTLYKSGSTNSSASYAGGDVLQMAFDIDTGKIWFGRNNTWLLSGNPATGANPWATLATGTEYIPFAYIGDGGSGSGGQFGYVNFGASSFAYPAPAGYKCLNTASLPASVVTKASGLMDVKLWTGNGSTQTISGLGFSPDLVWIKSRSNSYNHYLVDTVRGFNGANARVLQANLTDAESSGSGIGEAFTAFTSDGFTVKDPGGWWGTNQSSATYVGWAWDAGNTTVTNTQGSIASQVRANASAGFSIVTYTGNGNSASTVGHGLGVAPSLVIAKSRSASDSWVVYTNIIDGSNDYLLLNSTAAKVDSSHSSPTSTVFNPSLTMGPSVTCVAYCFAPVVGYSSMGSYVGNGLSGDSAPFIWTGFRPRWVMVKCSSSDQAGNADWRVQDSTRSSYNVVPEMLFANLSIAESTGNALMDFTSNGFKLRNTSSGQNASGATYIYAAFAESPFAANNRAR
jgi:hypothetical protein